MKQSIQWIAAVFMAASGSMALAGPGCGNCAYMLDSARVVPSRQVMEERFVIQRPMPVGERYVTSTPEPFHTVGNVVSLPFRAAGSTLAWTGRQFTGTSEMLSPRPEIVGERIIKVTTVKKTSLHHKKHHMYKKISYTRPVILSPVGERITTVKLYRPMLQPVGERWTTVRVLPSNSCLSPVGERFTTVRIIKSKPILQPVGERITTVKLYRPMLQPVGERWTTVRVLRSNSCLSPVGERFTTVRVIKSRPILQPIGERTVIIRSTRIPACNAFGCTY